MNREIFLCLTLALSSLGVKAHADDPFAIQNYEERRVGKVDLRIENLREGAAFDKKAVLEKLRTRNGDPFSQYIFDQDLKILAGEYDRIEPRMEVKNGKVDITLRVWLRPIINQVEWEGNSYIKTRTLRKELDIKPGILFNRTEFNHAFNKVKEYYIKKGYFEAEISYKLVSVDDAREVNIVIEINEGRSGKVENIVFKGFSKQDESHILQKLYTKRYSSLTSWFTGKGQFVEEALEQDRMTIFNYLQDEGYADAKVDIKILESEANGKVIIDIEADKGDLYKFGNVSFDGNILFSDEEIEKAFSARPGSIYSPEKLRKTTEAIKDLYGRKGFIETNISYETQLSQRAPVYNIHFHVDEGQEYKIGMLRVIGNATTESRVILRESLLIPGDKFDSLKLKVTQKRLENMGYFKSVNVYAVRTQDDLALGDNYRDIYIEVDETQTGNISLFMGASSAENVFGGLDLTERNFNIKGLGSFASNGTSSLRGGGEFLHLRSSLGGDQQSYLASWLTPYFLDSLWRVGFEFVATANNRLLAKNYEIDTYNFSTFISYPLSPYFSYGFKYRVQNFKNDVSRRILDAPQNDDEINEQTLKGILSGVGASINWDSTDSAVKPHRGLRSVIEGEFVGVGGNLSFFRAASVNSYYTPLWRRGYMRYRCDFRFLFPTGKTSDFADIPPSERFFLGGVSSVRGYKDFILGPRFDLKKGDSVKKGRGDPTGGISSSLLSIEYIQEVLPILEAFAFMDAGFVSDQTFDFGTYRMSYGAGLNIDVLGRMPITIGWGFPINASKGQKQKGHFFFSLGGQF